jgi:phosphatidylethanolamine-binding protein (PEBP) family uncharacterized protein
LPPAVRCLRSTPGTATTFRRRWPGRTRLPRHHYRFRLYALATALTLPARMDKEAVLNAIRGHILAEAELVATYERT